MTNAGDGMLVPPSAWPDPLPLVWGQLTSTAILSQPGISSTDHPLSSDRLLWTDRDVCRVGT